MESNHANPWHNQCGVVFALFTRELKSRFGIFHLGYLWSIAEPVALIGVLSAIRLAFGSSDIAGVPFPLFFASAIIPFLFFQTTVNECLQVVEANSALLNYRPVKPADAVFARWLLEVMVYSISGALIIAGIAFLGFNFRVQLWLELLFTLFLLGLFTLGIALLAAVVGPLFHESKKVVPILLRPLFFISGIFFAADALPGQFRDILLLNPLLHVSELVRFYLFSGYQSQAGSLLYLAVSALLSLSLGLAVFRLNRIRLATSGAIR